MMRQEGAQSSQEPMEQEKEMEKEEEEEGDLDELTIKLHSYKVIKPWTISILIRIEQEIVGFLVENFKI